MSATFAEQASGEPFSRQCKSFFEIYLVKLYRTVSHRMTQKFHYTCLVQDDTKVLMAKHDVQMMLETTQKQQQQFSDIPDQLPLDPNIPITFTKVKFYTSIDLFLKLIENMIRKYKIQYNLALQSPIILNH